jgi:hypothetical protein
MVFAPLRVNSVGEEAATSALAGIFASIGKCPPICVEIKNWRGSVYYPPANWAFGARLNGPPRPQQANTDCDTSQVVQDRQEDMVPQFTRIPYKKLRLSLVGSNDF